MYVITLSNFTILINKLVLNRYFKKNKIKYFCIRKLLNQKTPGISPGFCYGSILISKFLLFTGYGNHASFHWIG